MTDPVRATVRTTSFVAAGIAVVLSPVPLADEIALLPVFGVMTSRIAKSHGLAARDVPWRPIALSAFAALAARAAVNVTVSYIPGVAAAANAVSAVAITQLLGSYVDEACGAPGEARPLTVREVGQHLRDAIAKRRAPGTAAAT